VEFALGPVSRDGVSAFLIPADDEAPFLRGLGQAALALKGPAPSEFWAAMRGMLAWVWCACDTVVRAAGPSLFAGLDRLQF